MEYSTRQARSGDREQLRNLWRTSFGDSDEYIDSFMEQMCTPERTIVYEELGNIVSAAFVVELGEFVSPEGSRRPCRCVYAFSTSPEHRGWGIGASVIRAAAQLSNEGGAVGVICPAEYSLFGYYRRSAGYKDYFYSYDSSSSDSGVLAYGSAVSVDAAQYLELRRKLLEGRAYIDFSIKSMKFQEQLCLESGGGLFSVIAGGVQCAAAAEIIKGRLVIKELLVPSGPFHTPALLTARALGCRDFSYRTPVRPGEEGRPFGMISGLSFSDEADTGLGWYGFAFD